MVICNRKDALDWVMKGGSLVNVDKCFLKDKEIVQTAVKINGWQLCYADECLQDDKAIVQMAVENDGWAITYASKRLRDNFEIARLAVKKSGILLEYVGEHLQDEECTVRVAVENDGLAFKYASDRLRDNEEIVRIAVENDGLAFKCASDRLQDNEEIVRMAVKNNGSALQYASERLRGNPEIVLLAQENKSSECLCYASEELRSDVNFVRKYLEISDSVTSIRYACDNVKNDEETVRLAVSKCGLDLRHANPRFAANKDIVLLAVKNSGDALQYADEKLRKDAEVVKAAVKNSGDALLYADEEFWKDAEVVKAAVKNSGYALRYADEEFWKDAEVVETAVKSDGAATEFALLQEEKEISKKRILETVGERKIDNLVHFTFTENLWSILKRGLVPRKTMDEERISYRFTDETRLDEINGTSLSVSFPNCEMFSVKQSKYSYRDWCVLLLDPKKVLEMDCLFFAHNAATGRYRDNKFEKHRFIDFDSMFSDTVTAKGRFYRAFGEKESFYTTSPQAEIMCLEVIPPDCIKACVFKDEESKKKYEEYGDKIELIVDPWYFGEGPYSEAKEK